MKKFLIFLGLLAIIFICNTNKVYAMQRTNIFIDYYNQEFTTRYDSTFLNKLEDLKDTIDSYNIHERDYVITFNSYRIYIGIALPKTSYTNNYCTDYFIYTLKPSVVSSEYYIGYSISRAYCEQNGDSKASINGIEILVSDFNNNNYSTQLNNIRNLFINDQSSNAMNLYEEYTISGYNSAWNNIGYNLYYNSVPFGANTNPAYTIYYATKPIYFNNIQYANQTNNKTIQETCNITPSNQWTDAKFIYNDDTMSTELSCGDSITTYYEQMNSAPVYNEKMNIYYAGETKSIDMFFLHDTQDTYKIEIESTSFNQDDFTPTQYILYGEKCDEVNGKTCYFEQKENINNSSISNINYEYENNKIIITFDINIDLDNYRYMKLSIVNKPKLYDIKIKNINNTSFLLDLNEIGHKYSLITTMQLNEINAIYVNAKSGTINYRFYEKRIQEYGQTTYYEYDKTNNVVEKSIGTTIFKSSYFENDSGIYEYWLLATNEEYGNFYIQSGDIRLGTNSNVALYIAGEEQENGRVGETSIYMSDEVYFSFTQNFNLTINYGNTHDNIEYQVTNTYLATAFNNISKTDFGILTDIVEQYEEYKEEWLELFYTIYNPMPNIIKQIITIIYFLGCSYGIFLIFKD